MIMIHPHWDWWSTIFHLWFCGYDLLDVRFNSCLLLLNTSWLLGIVYVCPDVVLVGTDTPQDKFIVTAYYAYRASEVPSSEVGGVFCVVDWGTICTGKVHLAVTVPTLQLALDNLIADEALHHRHCVT